MNENDPAGPQAQELRAIVSGRYAEAPHLRRIWLRPERPLGHQSGQVVKLSVGGAEIGLFAVASAPREGDELQVLVRAGVETGSLLGLTEGALVSLAGPFGRGFAVTGLEPQTDLLLVGAGTAIAPLRAALIDALAQRQAFGRVTLVYGVRHAGDVCFVDEHDVWRGAGVDIRLVVSRPGGEPPWSWRVGWVQDHLQDVITDRTVAFVAGMATMEAATIARLGAIGVAADRIHTNYG